MGIFVTPDYVVPDYKGNTDYCVHISTGKDFLCHYDCRSETLRYLCNESPSVQRWWIRNPYSGPAGWANALRPIIFNVIKDQSMRMQYEYTNIVQHPSPNSSISYQMIPLITTKKENQCPTVNLKKTKRINREFQAKVCPQEEQRRESEFVYFQCFEADPSRYGFVEKVDDDAQLLHRIRWTRGLLRSQWDCVCRKSLQNTIRMKHRTHWSDMWPT